MCGFATMKASGRQEFVIQTKANDTRSLLHINLVPLGQSMLLINSQSCYAVASECLWLWFG